MNSNSVFFEFGPVQIHRISVKCAKFVNPVPRAPFETEDIRLQASLVNCKQAPSLKWAT
jgi:hypothetical protein